MIQPYWAAAPSDDGGLHILVRVAMLVIPAATVLGWTSVEK